jgi:hypothetical protein
MMAVMSILSREFANGLQHLNLFNYTKISNQTIMDFQELNFAFFAFLKIGLYLKTYMLKNTILD